MNFAIDADPLSASQARGSERRNATSAPRERLSVLFVTPFLPSPPTFGAQRRLHELISGVAALHDTSVLSLVDPTENVEAAIRATEEYCRRVVTVANPAYHAGHAGKRLRQLASLGSLHSYEWLGHNEKRFSAALEQMLAHHYDVVHFELAPMAAYAAACAGREPRPILCLDEHNIEYDIVRRTAGVDASVLRHVYSAIEWRKVRREERYAWSHLDGCTVTSVRDQEMLLAEAPAAHTAVVPNGVDLDFFHPSSQPPSRDPPKLLFFGAIDYHPNTDAMLFFLHDVFPQLAARYPRLCAEHRRSQASREHRRPAQRDGRSHRGGRRPQAVARAGQRGHRPLAHRGRHPSQDPRGDGDGQGRGVHDAGRRGARRRSGA